MAHYVLLMTGLWQLQAQLIRTTAYDEGFWPGWEDWSWYPPIKDGARSTIHAQSGNTSYFIQSAPYNAISIACADYCNISLTYNSFVSIDYWVYSPTVDYYAIQLTDLYPPDGTSSALFQHATLAGTWQPVTVTKDQFQWDNTSLPIQRINFFMISTAGNQYWFDNVSVTYNAFPSTSVERTSRTDVTSSSLSSSSRTTRITTAAPSTPTLASSSNVVQPSDANDVTSSLPTAKTTAAGSPASSANTLTSTIPATDQTTTTTLSTQAFPSTSLQTPALVLITGSLQLTATLVGCTAGSPCQLVRADGATIVLGQQSGCFWYSATSQLSGQLTIDVSGLSTQQLLDGSFCLFSSASASGQFSYFVLDGQTCDLAVNLDQSTTAAAVLTFSDASCSTTAGSLRLL